MSQAKVLQTMQKNKTRKTTIKDTYQPIFSPDESLQKHEKINSNRQTENNTRQVLINQ